MWNKDIIFLLIYFFILDRVSFLFAFKEVTIVLRWILWLESNGESLKMGRTQWKWKIVNKNMNVSLYI